MCPVPLISLPDPLQVAHKRLHHHQLTCSMMVALSPLYLGGGVASSSEGGARDVAGAEQMLTSAELLSRNNGDVVTRAAVKRVRCQVFP